MVETGKIFMNGRSQAVRLPMNFRFISEKMKKRGMSFFQRNLKTGKTFLP